MSQTLERYKTYHTVQSVTAAPQHDKHVIEWAIEQIIRKYGRRNGVRLERK